jgi:anti-sigma regulatory factor (Ser/Thr protein kinase)
LLTDAPEHDITYRLDAVRALVGHVRERARKALADWGLPEYTDLAQLIISELVTNAVCHGHGPITVRLSYAPGELHFGVHDFGSGRPMHRQPAPHDESGRGLELVDALIALHGGIRSIGNDGDGPGKTVCVTVYLTASQAADPCGT